MRMATDIEIIAHERDVLADRCKELTRALQGMLELEQHTHRLPGTANAEWVAAIVYDAKAALQ